MHIHRYTIFINKQDQSYQKKVDTIISSLVKCRVPRCSIRICNISDDEEFQKSLKEITSGVDFPYLFLWGEFFGGYDQVQMGLADGTLMLSVLNNPNKLHAGKKVGLIRPKSDLEKATIVDDYIHKEEHADIFTEGEIITEYENHSDEEKLVEMKGIKAGINLKQSSWISATEWLLRVLTGGLFSPLMAKPVVPQTVTKEEGDLDFDVVRTNWFWKHQPRTIRLSSKKFYRLNAGIFREEFLYENVLQVVVDGKNIVINFSKVSYSQFLFCDQVEEFLEELQKRCPFATFKQV
ncbi:hypothetical protein EIN_407430 [Entamoeba invadens IP1]|uniref:Uncharacterized protein n=1 Tax=Entamoeba invadens IP1 TaxID=370355 RepID=A0A0A1TWI0_ENTIV|nr:hypothetical protein EIN_407430 [Entamoeba invadens IP1]ELP85554.1 hypothetical protein EIN_407430 [Entamoeba invadens IP1]|eukprot:XP_004184900.1 hypothetical protein EIN_407430 [Entamoeba invadens IP1]